MCICKSVSQSTKLRAVILPWAGLPKEGAAEGVACGEHKGFATGVPRQTCRSEAGQRDVHAGGALGGPKVQLVVTCAGAGRSGVGAGWPMAMLLALLAELAPHQTVRDLASTLHLPACLPPAPVARGTCRNHKAVGGRAPLRGAHRPRLQQQRGQFQPARLPHPHSCGHGVAASGDVRAIMAPCYTACRWVGKATEST